MDEVREGPYPIRRSVATPTVSRTTADLATNFTAAEVRGVHVRVGQTVAHDFQGGVEITYGNALARRAGDICRRNRSGDSSGSGRWTIRLASATA